MSEYVQLWGMRVKKSEQENAKAFIEDLKDHLKAVREKKIMIKLSLLPLAPTMDFTMLDNESEHYPDELNALMVKSRKDGLTYEEKARAYFLANTIGIKPNKKNLYHYGKKTTAAIRES